MSASALLVDTDVASYLFKDDSRAQLYHPHLAGCEMVLSFVSLAELYRWAAKHQWGSARRLALEAHIAQFVVAGYSAELCRVWARVTVEAEGRGRALETGDAWVAATALLHDLPLVTHNRRHYEGVEGLRIISEAP